MSFDAAQNKRVKQTPSADEGDPRAEGEDENEDAEEKVNKPAIESETEK